MILNSTQVEADFFLIIFQLVMIFLKNCDRRNLY
jgi:hypothetical protein